MYKYNKLQENVQYEALCIFYLKVQNHIMIW